MSRLERFYNPSTRNKVSGPTPRAQPQFPADFIRQARREVKRKKLSFQAVQRYRLVLLLDENSTISHKEAGRQVGLSGRQVQRWRERWASGDFSINDRPNLRKKTELNEN